jgi:hypothetical protein
MGRLPALMPFRSLFQVRTWFLRQTKTVKQFPQE